MEQALEERQILLEILGHPSLYAVDLLLKRSLLFEDRFVRVVINGAYCGNLGFIVIKNCL